MLFREIFSNNNFNSMLVTYYTMFLLFYLWITHIYRERLAELFRPRVIDKTGVLTLELFHICN